MRETSKHVLSGAEAEQDLAARLQEAALLDRSAPDRALTMAKDIYRQAADAELHGLMVRALVSCARSARLCGCETSRQRYMEEAETLNTQHYSPEGQAVICDETGKHYQSRAQYSRAECCFLQALRYSEPDCEPLRYAGILNSLGSVNLLTGSYEKALHYFLQSLSLYRESGQPVMIALASMNIGIVYFELEDTPRALQYYRKSLHLYEAGQDVRGIALAKSNIGSALARTGKPGEALDYFQESLALWRTLNAGGNTAATLSCIGSIYEQTGELERALAYQEEALALVNTSGKDSGSTGILYSLGVLHHKLGCPETALSRLREALERAEKYKLRKLELEICRDIATVFAAVGEMQSAYTFNQRAMELHETILGSNSHRAVAALEVGTLQTQSLHETRRLRSRAEKAEQEAADTVRELHSISLKLTQRDEACKTLKKLVEPYARNARGQAKQLAHSILSQVLHSLEPQGEWETLEQQFTQEHRAFLKKLMKRCPALTPTELKICILIRMERSTKQISNTLFIAYETVKTHRKHIRRKLNLHSSENLTSLLLSL